VTEFPTDPGAAPLDGHTGLSMARPVLPPTTPVAPSLPVAPLMPGTAGLGLPVSPPVPPPVGAVAAALPVGPVAPAVPSVAPPMAPVSPPQSAPGVPGAPVPPPTVGLVPPAMPASAPVPVPSQPGPAMPPPASTPGMSEIVERADADSKVDLGALLEYLIDVGGSDLHLSAGTAPRVRLHGDLSEIPDAAPLTPTTIQNALYAVMDNRQQQIFEANKELDFAYTLPGKARFRVNVHRQNKSVGAVMRIIPYDIKSLEALNLPEVIGTFADLPRGLVLVTGPTGSGKSTTLAAVVDKANRTRHDHIMTIEDPVEFIHPHKSCIVNQREVGEDTHSFAAALKHVLRQDPDIILVGELRDLETISVALTAAETGHLVLATLHTQSAQETITRIIDAFPAGQQAMVRTQLAASLQGVVCQTLPKTRDGLGRAAAVEIMVVTPDIRAMIRDGKLEQIQSAIQGVGQKHGSQTLNMSLAGLVKTGKISYEAGLEKCSDKNDFGTLVGSREQVEAELRRLDNLNNNSFGMSMGGM
jgi:twitching motility protein PilT